MRFHFIFKIDLKTDQIGSITSLYKPYNDINLYHFILEPMKSITVTLAMYILKCSIKINDDALNRQKKYERMPRAVSEQRIINHGQFVICMSAPLSIYYQLPAT